MVVVVAGAAGFATASPSRTFVRGVLLLLGEFSGRGWGRCRHWSLAGVPLCAVVVVERRNVEQRRQDLVGQVRDVRDVGMVEVDLVVQIRGTVVLVRRQM